MAASATRPAEASSASASRASRASTARPTCALHPRASKPRNVSLPNYTPFLPELTQHRSFCRQSFGRHHRGHAILVTAVTGAKALGPAGPRRVQGSQRPGQDPRLLGPTDRHYCRTEINGCSDSSGVLSRRGRHAGEAELQEGVGPGGRQAALCRLRPLQARHLPPGERHYAVLVHLQRRLHGTEARQSNTFLPVFSFYT